MTREHILQISTIEFATLGYDGVSMNNLAQKLEVNKATIYYHFKDKRALYQEVIKSLMLDKQKDVTLLFEKQISAKEMFQEYIKASINILKQKPYVIQLMLRELSSFGSNIDENIVPIIDREYEIISTILNKLNIKEKYKDIDKYTFISLIHGTISMYYSFQMSPLEFKDLKDLKQDSNMVLDFISEFVSNILLDAICEE